MFDKMNVSVVQTIIEIFVGFNRPNAVGRLVEVVGKKLSPAQLLDKIPNSSGSHSQVSSSSVKINVCCYYFY